MNKHIIIGNLTADPVGGTTPNGRNYSRFTVAVNRGKDQPADFMRVTAWQALGDTCQRFLRKGRKVCVVGRSTAYAWQGDDGVTRGQIQIDATDVEFLSSAREDAAAAEAPPEPPKDPESGMEVVDEKELPF